MREILSSGVDFLNHFGQSFCDFAGTMLVQVTILVAVMLVLELLLSNRVRAVVRYWLWLLVLVKLVLPINLHTPASLAYWLPAARPQAVSAQSTPAHGPPAPSVARPTQFATPADELEATSSRTEFIPFGSGHDRQDAVPTTQSARVVQPALEVPRLQWRGALFGLWFIGVASLLTIVARRALWVRRLVRQATNAPAELREQLRACLSALRMATRVTLKISNRLGSPAICGLWRPTILLPSGFPGSLDREQARMVFIHELVHWRRGDLLVNTFQTLLQILYFYNPAVWLANLIIRRLREQAVDETVLVAAGGQPDRYASTLLDLAAGPLRPLEATLRLTGVVESRNAIAARIKRITFLPIPKTAKLGLAGLAAVTIVGTALLPMGRRERAFADDQPSKKVQNTVPMKDSSVVQTKPSDRDSSAAKSPALPAATSKGTSEKRVALTVTGRATDSAGKPIAGAIIHLRAGANPELTMTTTSHSDGSYEFKDVQVMLHQANGTREQLCSGPLSLYATAPGFGFAWSGRRYFWDRKKPSDEEMGHDQWTKRTVKTDFFRDDPPVIDLEFAPAASFKGRVIDDDHQPIAGADVSLWDADYLNGEGKPLWIEYRKFSDITQVLPREQLHTRSDNDGRFEIGGLPAEVCFLVQVEHAGDANTSFYAATTDRPLTVHHFNNSATTIQGNMQVEIAIPEQHEIRTGDLTIMLHHVRSVLIDVVEDGTERPAANVGVSTNSVLGHGPSAHGKTNKDGRVELKLPIGQYPLTADPPRDSLYVRTRATLDGTAGRDKEPFTIRLVKGCIVNFEAVDLESSKGIEGIGFQAQEVTPAPPYRPVPPGHSILVQSTTGYADNPRTDKDGRMRAVMQPGTYKFTAAPQWLGRHNVGDEYESGFAPSPTRLPSGESVEIKIQLKRKPEAAKTSLEKATERDPLESKPAAGADPPETSGTGKSTDATVSLSGRIVDETGQPVTDAMIRLFYTRTGKAVGAKSDEHGEYRFTGLKDFGEYQIDIKSHRWVGITDHNALPHVDIAPQSHVVRDFTLPRACRMRVRVIDDQGHPIAKVFVDASLPGEMKNFGGRGTTDAAGWTTLDAMKPSGQERIVTTRSDDYASGRIAVTLDDPTVVVNRLIVLQKAAVGSSDVKGTAVCSDGKPPTGWGIHAYSIDTHASTRGPVVAPDGSFTLPNVVPGTYDIVVDIPVGDGGKVFTPTRVISSVKLPADKPLVVKIDYPSPASMATISGDIEFADDLLGRAVNVEAYSSTFKYRDSAFVNPGQHEFKLGPMPRATYTLEFASKDIEQFVLRDVPCPSEKLHVKLKIIAALSLHGVVVRADTHEPISHFRVQVTKLRTSRGRNYVQRADWHEFNDKRGAFAVDLIGPGVYSAVVAADGFAPTRSEPFDTDRDAEREVRIELGPGVPLSGMVVDEQGHGIDGVKVVALPDEASMRGANRWATFGDNIAETRGGAFTIEHFSSVLSKLKFVDSEFSPTTLENVKVGQDGKAAPLAVTLHSGATVHGHVYDERGQPEDHAVLEFQDQHGYSGLDDENRGRIASAVTDLNGFYEVRHLPDGFWYVQRPMSSPWHSRGVLRHAVQTTNGKTQTLDLGGTTELTGRLIVNGAPLAGAKVQLAADNPLWGTFSAIGRTDAKGAFVFWGPPAGRHTLYFATPEESTTWVRAKELTVTPRGGNVGDVQCAVARLTVRVKPAAEGEAEGTTVSLGERMPNLLIGFAAGKSIERQNRSDPFVFEQVPSGEYQVSYHRPNQFSVNQVIEITSGQERSVVLDLPHGSGALSGKIDATICGPESRSYLGLWSKDERLHTAITPREDGTYRVDNVPTGDYSIRNNYERGAAPLITVSVQEGENKTLDITPQTVAAPTKPIGYVALRALTPDGVPIVGCDVRFDDGEHPPALLDYRDGRSVFTGTPGPYAADIGFPGFKQTHRTLELNPAGKNGAPRYGEARIELQPNDE